MTMVLESAQLPHTPYCLLFSEAVGKELEALKEELGVPAYSVAQKT